MLERSCIGNRPYPVAKKGAEVKQHTKKDAPWEPDDGNHPKSVTVQLYCDDEKHGEEVTLNEANGWQYTWKDLPADHTWAVWRCSPSVCCWTPPEAFNAVYEANIVNGQYFITAEDIATVLDAINPDATTDGITALFNVSIEDIQG